ncbi:MAG: hypothetical protein A2945_00005 [Candidatus Liptonbacteria bacterium RIFCSPLOWO2_01_FULL_52_25]|uniref:Uncharacterized protein n=1 Tax=Candidatus Liptonbacteria bacterium RIFCSPLOWO2_01_FULL_52_25 TaxID=1798650 RepID=A0A1G2CFQ5_9BACT|nr:MAG: hypothetical protein A2945_00005 [Candidatus Liptonbacteria bacterium RIFCSPLOWO2_01_FULL_52_25]
MTLHWQQFTRNDQLLAISAEIVRASIWEQKDREKFVGALERAFALIDASLDDPRWQSELSELLCLRDEIGKYYCGERRGIGALSAAM